LLSSSASLVIVLGLLTVACQEAPASASPRSEDSTSDTATSAQSVVVDEIDDTHEFGKDRHAPSVSSPTPSNQGSSIACQQQWAEIMSLPTVEGAPALEEQRATMLARAKAEPIYFLRTPRWSRDTSPVVESFRRHLTAAEHQWDALSFQLGRFAARPDIGAQVLLRDGYLYAEHPHMAYAFEQQVRPEHLFDAPRIWIQRGRRVYWAKRTPNGEYVYEGSSSKEPQRVGLLHLDRLGTGTPPPPLHVDLRDLRQRLFFDTMQVVHATEKHLLANLHYGSRGIDTVLRIDGARLDVDCEVVPPSQNRELDEYRQRAKLRFDAWRRLQRAMHQQVVDALPFDEPRNETGVQDGVLRARWQRAYAAGRNSYSFGDETYGVFGRLGAARPPQVCVDFLTDTFERASGSWWAAAGQPRSRSRGGIDFSDVDELKLRRLPDLLRFAKSNPHWFDVWEVTPSERIPIGHRQRFFPRLERDADKYDVADIVVVRGYTNEDQEHMHSHSFFVYETDPITGVPIAIVGNAGMPHIWSLEGESRRAPERTIRYVLRPKLPLLEKVLSASEPAGPFPTPLVEEPI
jgi:hypothetical protein